MRWQTTDNLWQANEHCCWLLHPTATTATAADEQLQEEDLGERTVKRRLTNRRCESLTHVLSQSSCLSASPPFSPADSLLALKHKRHPQTHTHTHTRARACAHARMHARMHACMHARTHTRKLACAHARTRARAHTRTHALTHTHIVTLCRSYRSFEL